MNILITGASGFIGRALSADLLAAGHRVVEVFRKGSGHGDGQGNWWDPSAGAISISADCSIDAVIHLAGENIADGRWSVSKRGRIFQSRVCGTKLWAHYLAAVDPQPKVMISVSGVGYYGETGDAEVDESYESGNMFLSEVCKRWELACEPARLAGIRVVHARLGMVISSKGGALAKMLPTFQRGVGGVIGSGSQWMSWVSLEDVLGAFRYLLKEESMHGPVNVVSPNPVTNRDFTCSLGNVLQRRTPVRMPGFVVKVLLGQMGEELLLTSCRAMPGRLTEAGYDFKYPDLTSALGAELGEATR